MSVIHIAKRFELRDPQNPDNLLGQGGMGTVYRGLDTVTGETVAIKALRPELVSGNAEMLRRFVQEGEALRQLNHPNIVTLLGTDEVRRVPYLVMEYVGGGSLSHLLHKSGPLSVQRALYVALDLADALTRAHRLNILHRDIKPGNVLLAQDGTPRLTDFGMAYIRGQDQLTQEGMIVGTLAYLAPEIFEGKAADERSDIWSFGVLIYEMLSARRPFEQELPGALIHAVLNQPPPDLEALRPDLPSGLVDLVGRMLTREAAARIPSVRVVGAELEVLLRGSSRMQAVIRPDDTSGRFNTPPTPSPLPSTQMFSPPNNLPTPPTAFVGRQSELDTLHTLLDSSDTRLVTILGAGGIGKTRLALEVAHTRLARYPDGIFFVGLDPIEEPDLLLGAIADSIGLNFGGGDPQRELLDALRERNTLLLLDNFEHLSPAAPLLAAILAAAPHIQILVTSRERLRLQGEQLFELDGMRLPRVSASVEDLAELPAAQLFIQRAHRVQPDFELNASTAPHIARIVRQVDGLPLGIELAASWLEALSVEEIASEMARSLDFLETDLRDVPARHRSLRAVFDYSWRLLNEDERQTFSRLSVFRGGFTREAAQRVADAGLRVLTNLVNKSLLQRDSGGRYSANTLLAQYAAESLAVDEAQAIKLEHAAYYAEYMERLTPAFSSSRERHALEQTENEIENLRAAWQRALRAERFELIDRMQHGMLLYYVGRSLLNEGHARFRDLVAAMEAAGEGENRIAMRARVRQAWIGSRLGYYDEASRLSQRASVYFRAQDERAETAHALNNLCYVSMMQGHYQDALNYGAEATRLVQNFEDVTAWAMGMGNLGYVYYLLGDYNNARIFYESIEHAVSGQIDYAPSGLAYGKNNLGEILWALGDADGARQLFEDAYAVFKAYNYPRGMAFTLNNLGGLYDQYGQFEEAERLYRQAQQLNREIGDRTGIAHSLSALGRMALARGDFEKGRSKFEESLRIRRELGDQRGVADSLNDLGQLELAAGQPQAALRLLREAVTMRRAIGDREGEGVALAIMALAQFHIGQTAEAETAVHDLQRLSASLDHSGVRVLNHIAQGELALRQKRLDDAQAAYREALRNAGGMDTLGSVLFALEGLAGVYLARADYPRALELVAASLQHPRAALPVPARRSDALLNQLRQHLPARQIDKALADSQPDDLGRVVAAMAQDKG